MNYEDVICPECASGRLVATEYSDSFLYNGKPLEVAGLEKYVCDTCGADPVFPYQMRRNEQLFADAKRRASGRALLSGSEVREFRDRHYITQQEAAQLFGGGTNAFSKYERGVVVQSESMDRLIRLVDRHPYLMDDLRALSGMPVDPPTYYGITWSGSISLPTASVPKSVGEEVVVYMDDYRRCA